MATQPQVPRWPGAVMALLTVAVVATIAGVGWSRLEEPIPRKIAQQQRPRTSEFPPPRPSPQAQAQIQAAPAPPPPPPVPVGPPALRPGRDYYAHVKLVEVRPKKPDGGQWELRGDSAPDLFYKLYNGPTLVFTSPTRDDRLIAEWDLLRIDVLDAIQSRQIEVASAVNAPILHIDDGGGGTFKIEVFDKDTFTYNDEAGTLTLPVSTLKEGVNELNPNPDGEGGLARIVIDFIPRDISLPDLLQRASDR